MNQRLLVVVSGHSKTTTTATIFLLCLFFLSMASKKHLLVCTPLEAPSMEEMLASMDQAKAEGADLVELRIDSMSFSQISEVESLIKQRTLPAIVSFRYEIFDLLTDFLL